MKSHIRWASLVLVIATLAGLEGNATPILLFFNARARSGRQYRVAIGTVGRFPR